MKKFLFLIFILSSTLFGFEEKDAVIRDNAQRSTKLYNFELNNWKFKVGDDKNFSDPDFNDSKWGKVTIGTPLKKHLAVSGRNGAVVWYRKEFILNEKLPNLLWFELGYISAGNTVYINGREIASTPHRGATFTYRRYLLKNAPFKVGKNLLAIRVQLGFMKGMYNGTPTLYEAKLPQLVTLFVHKNAYKNPLKRQISNNSQINTFSPKETIAVQQKIFLTNDNEVECKIVYYLNNIEKVTTKILKPKQYTYFDTIEFPAQKVGKHKLQASIYINNQFFDEKEITFTVEQPQKFTLPKNTLTKGGKIPLNSYSTGSNGPRILSKKTILTEKNNFSEIRGSSTGAIGISYKHNGILPLFTHVNTPKGKWVLSDWDNNLGSRYDGITTPRPLGIVELNNKKLTSFKCISSTWTSRTYQLNYGKETLTCENNQLSPGWLLETQSNSLRLFRPVKFLSYGPPSKIYPPLDSSLKNLTKNFFVISWEKSNNFKDVYFPIVVILEHKPKLVTLDKQGVLLNFENSAGKVHLVPLYGVKPLATRALTKEDLIRAEKLAKLVPGLPYNVQRYISVDWNKSSLIVQEDFTHAVWKDDWKTPIKKYSPISPSFVLASASNFIKLSNNKNVIDCNYPLNAGPLCVVESSRHITKIDNLTKYVREERAVDNKLLFDKKLAAKLESYVLAKLRELEKHPWGQFTAKNSNVTVGALEPEFTNLLLTMPFLSPKTKKRLINAIDKEAKLTFTNDNLLVNGKRRKKKTPITSHLTNSATNQIIAAPYIHAHQGGIDGPCWIGNQISLLWNYAYYCNRMEFLENKLEYLERYLNTLINSNDWSYSVSWDSHSGIRVGNGLQESTIFHAAFAAAAKFYHNIGNYSKRDQMAAYSMLHLVGISSVVSSQTAKYLRENRPYLATHPDALFIERDERLLPNHFFEFNERGGLFHSIMRGGSEPLFSNTWIMTQTPNVMRPFKELWTKATNDHYRPTLSDWRFELPVPVDTYLYMTSKPPFSIEKHYQVRMAFPLKDDSRIADIRAFLEYQTKTKWVKLW